MNWVWEHSTEKSSRLLLLLAIANFCNDDGVCYPSVGTLAKKCRLTTRRTQQLLDALQRGGELGVATRYGLTTNGGKTNRYYLNGYRASIGLPTYPRRDSTTVLPEGSFREGGEENFREGGEETCTTLPEETFTTLPEEGFTQTVSVNHHFNRHPTHSVCARTRESMSDLETLAMQWAAAHPFWSTRITDLVSLRRNLAKGKSFQMQFAEAQRMPDANSKHIRGGDYHATFWQRAGLVLDSSTAPQTLEHYDDDD